MWLLFAQHPGSMKEKGDRITPVVFLICHVVFTVILQEGAMPVAQPLPKKHLATIRDAQSELKGLAQRLGHLLERLDASPRSWPETMQTLQALQSNCYAVALRLSEVEVANGCDGCPCAPARTQAEIHLALLSQKLRCLSEEMWQHSQPPSLRHHPELEH